MGDHLLSRREVLASAAGSIAAGAAAQGVSRPNVLFFLPDQVRTCELGCYGGGQNAPTPHLDHFASQGMRFTHAVSTYPLCTPYRAMLQTGQYPSISGGVFNWINLPHTGQAMADSFSRAGYYTGYIGKWHLAAGERAGSLKRSVPAPPAGPEPEFVPPGPARMGYQYWAAFNFHAQFSHAFYYRDTSRRLYMPKYETDSETDMAIDFLKERGADNKPFFLIVSPHPPHPPWRTDEAPAANLAATPKDLCWRSNVQGRRDSPARDPRCYFAMMANMDDNFGRLMKYLDESGLAASTIVVMTSDHGEMLASHNRYDKMVPYQEALSVPLLIRWPGHIQPRTQTDVLYTPIDHYPTLAKLCGFSAPDVVNGKDLSQLVTGEGGSQPEDVLIMNFSSHWDYPETGTVWPEWRGVRNKQYTYFRWINGAEELYDNAADPYQTRNLFDGRNSPDVLKKLRSRLRDHLYEAHDEFLPGDHYTQWFDTQRNVIRNGLGPVKRT
jgi:arylsulfatase A-like enzyme